ncbi:MAG: DUF1906 domain-containing protein [Lachnospiraceae bacterium]|nr:DUF1906 domain-containing protein [Lachnospiraceae bacterium]
MKKKLIMVVVAFAVVIGILLGNNNITYVSASGKGKDAKVLEGQKWLNKTYKGKEGYVVIAEDGIAGRGTTKALIRAIQIQLKVDVDGGFGEGTRSKFPILSSKTKQCKLTKIMQYALYCKGYDAGVCDGKFHAQTQKAVTQLQKEAGYKGSGVINGHWAQAILSTDVFKLVNGGDVRIRNMQKYLNANYFKYIGIEPCDGVYTVDMYKNVIKALQGEEGFTPEQANGHFGEGTYSRCPDLKLNDDRKEVVLLRIALEINGFNKKGGLGTKYDEVLASKVKEYQEFMNLPNKSGDADKGTITSLLKTCGDTSRDANALDTATKLNEETIAQMKEKGYEYVGRYLTQVDGGLDKAMTKEEAQMILAAGMKIIPIYQTIGDNNVYFSAKQGEADAKEAYEAAKALGIVSNSTIYFAVDYDAYGASVTNQVMPYFDAINTYFRQQEIVYNVGVYASRACCNTISNNNLAKYSYVRDMSYGSGGNMGVAMPKNWAFDQYAEIKDMGIGLDKVNASGRDVGVSELND